MLTAHLEDKTVQTALAQLHKKLANRRDAHREITRRVVTRVQQCFRTSTDPWGGAWDGLKGRSGRPLRDTGRLMNSIPAASTSDNDSSTIGTNVKYGITHQQGRTITAQPGNPGHNVVGPRKGSPFLKFQMHGRWVQVKQVEIPARPFLPERDGVIDLPPEWRESVLEAVTGHLGGGGR